jgi:RHS repeat-associated protein
MLFTGQRRESSFGLYYYGARWYDPYLNRWIQPDTVIPQQQGVQAWDRYAYANNNPVKYTDPTGKGVDCGMGDSSGCRQRVGKEQVGKVSNPIPVSTQSAMQTQANSPFTLATQLATPPGPFLGPAPTPTPTPSPTSTPTPIPQGQVAETINNTWTAGEIIDRAWGIFQQHFDIAAPNPIVGFFRGAYVQSAQDHDDGSFSGPEILLRGGVSGLEGAATDVASTGGGLMAGGAGLGTCGPVCGAGGYIIGAGATYVAVDNAFNSWNEDFVFPFIHGLFSGE